MESMKIEQIKYKNIYPNLIKINRYQKKVNAIFKENSHVNNNYNLNLKLSSQMKIILEIYSEENPTNLYFKSILTMNELYDLYSDFKTYNNINDIYEFMNDIINKGNYEIKFDGESAYLILLFNNTKINIILNKEKVSFEPSDSELNEFINQFYKDFLDLKQNILNNKINDNNKEILELKKENQIFKDKIEEIQKENIILKNKINDLNKNLFKLKQSITPKKKSKNYLKKEDIFNQANISKYNNIGYEYDNNSNIYNNNNQYFNYIDNYNNPSNPAYNYYHSTIDSVSILNQ